MVLQHEVEKVDSLIIMLGKFSREMIARSVFLARQEEKEKAYTCSCKPLISFGAGDGFRTRNPQLGRLMLCQLSYSRLFLCRAIL